MIVEQDTIAAISTALGEAGIGVVRVSGPDVTSIADKMFRLQSGTRLHLPEKRSVHYGYFVNPLDEGPIDEGLLLWMPNPHSYTGEDVVELQVHGGVRIVQSVLESVLRSGARLAEPGEFTKRAFLNGRMDLSQAEAVMDLIRSKTDLAAKSAFNQVKGHFSETIRRLRKQLISLQAHVEVVIDYPEHDVEDVACEAVVKTGNDLLAEIGRLLESVRFGKILREGVATAIVGRPNVGKSSLLNALLRRDRAIVTDIPGTTRDVLEEYANIRGLPFRLIDTAGIRETDNLVEQLGVERSREIMQSAELLLVLLDGHEAMKQEDAKLLDLALSYQGVPKLIVVNKMDLDLALDVDDLRRRIGDVPLLTLSVKEARGLAALEEEMEHLVLMGTVASAETAYMTNNRQADLLRQAQGDVTEAVEAAKSGATLDMIAVLLQSAYASLGLIIGEETREDLLDEIFSNFCLGK